MPKGFSPSGESKPLDPKRAAGVHTAWELCGDWWWVGVYSAVQVGGQKEWETATATKGGTGRRVLMSRLDELHQVNQYVDPQTQFMLKPIA